MKCWGSLNRCLYEIIDDLGAETEPLDCRQASIISAMLLKMQLLLFLFSVPQPRQKGLNGNNMLRLIRYCSNCGNSRWSCNNGKKASQLPKTEASCYSYATSTWILLLLIKRHPLCHH